MSILYYGFDGKVHGLGDKNTLIHYNHNHDKLGRFARSNNISSNGYTEVKQIFDSLSKSEKRELTTNGKYNDSKYLVVRKIDSDKSSFAEIERDPDDLKVGYISVATKPDFRGQGKTEELVLSALKDAKTQGIKEVYWETTKNNKASENLAKGLGFKQAKNYSKNESNWVYSFSDKKDKNDFVQKYSDTKFRGSSKKDINDYMKLQKEIENKSVDWYNSNPKTKRTKAVYEKYKDKDIYRGLSPDKDKFEDELAGAVLKDLGYKDTPEARRRIRYSKTIVWD